MAMATMAMAVVESMEKFWFWGNVIWPVSVPLATKSCSDDLDKESSELKIMVEEEQQRHQPVQQPPMGLFERRHRRSLSDDMRLDLGKLSTRKEGPSSLDLGAPANMQPWFIKELGEEGVAAVKRSSVLKIIIPFKMDFLMRLAFESIFEDEEEYDYFSQVPVNDEGDKKISLESDPPLHDNPVAIDMDDESAERKLQDSFADEKGDEEIPLEQEHVIEDMENVNIFDFDAELRFIEEWIVKPKIVADCIETTLDEMPIDIVPSVSTITFAEAKINDFEVELKFIEDWLEKPKYVDYVYDAECIRFADAEEILLQISTTQHIADCNPAWRTIISEKFAEFAEAQGRFRTADAQSNSIMNSEDFKLSNWKSRKRENINKYYITSTKVKMKKMEDCRVQRLETQKIKL